MENNTNNLQLASMSSRGFAFVIDDLIVTIIIIAVFWDNFTSLSNNPEQLLVYVKEQLLIPLVLLKILYQTIFVWYYGATIGKIITKIKIIDFNSLERVSFFSSFLRACGRIFSEMFFYIGFLIGFFNDGRRTFHDITGKTLVVNA